MSDLVNELKALLADEIAMFLKAQGFHWNVEGPMFHQFHKFFGEIYSDVYGAVDPTAEYIRTLEQFAPFTLPAFNKLREVSDEKVTTDPLDMCVDLADANDMIIDRLEKIFKLADAADEQGIADFVAGRESQHKKWRWQLTATIKQ